MSIASPSRAVSSGMSASIVNSRPFLLLCAWGTGATLAVIAAVAVGRTELGGQRARAAMTAILSSPQGSDQQLNQQISEQLSSLSGEFDKERRRQTEVIRVLTEQRDSLADRVGLLERQFNELGTAFMRTTARLEGETRAAQQAAAAASAVAASSRTAQPRPDSPESQLPAAVPPTASLPGRTAAPPAASSVPPGQVHPAGSAMAGPPATSGWASSPSPYTGTNPPYPSQPAQPAASASPWPTTSTHLNGIRASLSAPPSPVPMFRSNPLMTTGIFATPADPAMGSAEFAIDLGAASTVEALRTRWNELRVSQSPLLDNLTPVISLRDGTKAGQELHLVAGPLTNNSAAHRLCAVLVGTNALCQPTLYEGQRLDVR